MSVLLAFIAGTGVTFASMVVPHARSHQNSIEEFHTFQQSLATLPVARAKNHKQTH